MQAGILHRDLSLSNIMHRIIREQNSVGVVEEKICRVLTDFDLASWTEDLKRDDSETLQRMGMSPFMAYKLLRGSDILHLYRHNLESLFYIMLILAIQYEIQLPTSEEEGGLRMQQGLRKLPYQRWFNQPLYETLASLKCSFLSDVVDLNLSLAFKDFHHWLLHIHRSFEEGINAKRIHKNKLIALQWDQGDGSENEATPGFDGETLGGNIDYSRLIDPVYGLKGELEGLIICYNPSRSTSATKTNGWVDSAR